MLNIVFDMDGVILDTERLCLATWQEAAAEYGIRDVEKMYRECIGVTFARTREIILAHLGSEFPLEEFIQKTNQRFKALAAQGLPVKKGARELLQWLQERGAGVALASSTGGAQVERELKGAGLYSYFQVIVSGEMVKRSKPNPDIFLEACRRLGSDPAGTIGIEDSFNGVKALSAAGMKTVMVPDLIQPDEEILGLTDKVFTDLFAVKSWLEELC